MAKNSADYDLRDPGWMDRVELDRIAAFLRAGCPGPILEIGCYAGRTTRVLLEATTGLVICIDPLNRNKAMPRWPCPDGVWIETRRHMVDRVTAAPSRLIVVPCFAEEVFGLVKLPLGALVIDTEHSYEPTLRQIDEFAPLVKVGGAVILDDYDLEPVSSAWRDSKWRHDAAGLTEETFSSLLLARVCESVLR